MHVITVSFLEGGNPTHRPSIPPRHHGGQPLCPHLWNSLPVDRITCLSTLPHFRSLLKTHLFRLACTSGFTSTILFHVVCFIILFLFCCTATLTAVRGPCGCSVTILFFTESFNYSYDPLEIKSDCRWPLN